VLARASGREDVVFGTVLFGRMQGGSGADRVLGLFINTLPVRIRVGEASAQDGVRQTHALLGQLLRHEHAPLALAQRCSAVTAPTPLFSALLNYRHSVAEDDVHANALGAWDGIEPLGSEERTNYPLTLSVDDLGEGFALEVQVQSSIDPQRVCAFVHTALERLVDALERAPTTPLHDLDVMPASERHQLLVEWNDTAADYPRDRCIHQLFEDQVERTPEAVAVVFEEAQLTYRELSTRANQVAHHLRALGVGPEVLVGICLERSLELVIGLLGILKAGGAYVPLDPSYPTLRLAFMLADTQAPVLLTQERLLGQLPPHAGRTLCLDRDWAIMAVQPETNPRCTATGTNLAYVMYTSGSTGQPKGVMIEHRGVCNHLVGHVEAYRLDGNDCILQTAAISFDQSVWQIFVPLMVGSRLVLPDPGAHRSPEVVVDLMRRYDVTIMRTVPTLLSPIVNEPGLSHCAPLRMVFCGGEALDKGLAERFTSQSEAQLIQTYGPTESTVHSTYFPYRRDGGSETIPIGRPIANTEVYVLDPHRQPVPVGVAGELYVGGDGLARGYWKRPELTAERFVPDPFNAHPGARLYRTGDRVRYLPDGNLEFLGRLDDQVKLRGFRIELGEIEAVLTQQPQVREAAVLLREDTPGDARLVAYVVLQGETLVAVDLRAALKQRLPDYMVPAAFVPLPALPLTPNGKIDRKALPAPTDGSVEGTSHLVAPRDNIELQLVKIWEDVLASRSIGVRDNFFDVGGHSLLAVQLMGRIDKTFHRRLPLDTLWFGGGTIEALAQILRDVSRSSPDPGLELMKMGSRRPLFVVHTTGGNLFHYFDLVRRLDADQTVYGLQARGVNGTIRPDRTIEAIAAHCIESMRTAQPDGPYLLAGFSSGGVVAFEMARQLASADQQVTLLALFDTYAPRARIIQMWLHELAAIRGRKWNLRHIQELAYFSVLHPLHLDRLRQLRATGEAHRWAHWSYRPKPQAIPIELFIAEKSSGRGAANKLGWTRWTHGTIRFHHFPGEHSGLVKPPIVDDLAARLQACIDDAAGS
jgi:amino acid adenylation domain-containing protein